MEGVGGRFLPTSLAVAVFVAATGWRPWSRATTPLQVLEREEAEVLLPRLLAHGDARAEGIEVDVVELAAGGLRFHRVERSRAGCHLWATSLPWLALRRSPAGPGS